MALTAPVTMPRAAQVLPSRRTLSIGDVDQAHHVISDLFCEHRLAPVEQRRVQMRLRSAHDGGVGVEMLDYGEAVRISPVGLESFHLVQIPIAGRARMTVGNAEVTSSTTVATIPPVDRGFTMTWDKGSPHLIVYVRRDGLLAAAASLFATQDLSRLSLAPTMRLDTPQGLAFLRAVFELHDALEQTTPDGSYARSLAAELMLTRLLAAVDNSVARSLSAWGGDPAPVRDPGRGDRLYQRFLDVVDSSVDDQSGVLEIARTLGVPLRTLQDHVHAASGRTPTAVLKDARFQRARALLAAADPAHDTVTAIAERCGFSHLGRFSSEYPRRYGESPAQTLRG